MGLNLHHISCLEHVETITSSEGKEIPVWELHVPDDVSILSRWAAHFRNHYCLDAELDCLREGTGLSREDYLLQLIFPDRSAAPGPAVRSGDFAEILISDYLESVLRYWVPRDKFLEKAVRNESVKGVDIVGIRLAEDHVSNNNSSDILISFEVKAKLTAKKYDGTLQDAINHSHKDYFRIAATLNATKRRLIHKSQNQAALVIQRFQNPTDHPYIRKSGAAAVISSKSYDIDQIKSNTFTIDHENSSNLSLLVLHGADLMKLVGVLYERAANEA